MNTEQPTLPEMVDLWQATLDWQPDPDQQALFQRLYELILDGNRSLNLTRITAPEDFWEKHLWDSLRGIRSREAGVRAIAPVNDMPELQVIDIGTGPGFPGIPVAIAHSTWRVTLLDATRKKTAFLDTLLASLHLTNGNTLTGRVEQVGQDLQHRERYDLALIRAVATAPVCAEYGLPLLKVGGLAVLYRGQWTEEEATALLATVELLGGTLEAVDAFTTPLTQSIRHCLYLRKISPTPRQFPRAVGTPAQKPLVVSG